MQRAFILGNGPSLKETPLDLLNNEVTFATNRIHFIYPETSWRPNFYVRAESMADTQSPTEAWLKDLLINIENPDTEVWCNPWFTKKTHEATGKSYDANAIKACAHYTTNFDSEYCPHLWHLPVLCSYGSSVNVAVQMAVQMGYGPIYLLGCDLGYGSGQDHFYPDSNDNEYEKRSAAKANVNTLNAHIIASRSSTVPIINATIGGQLEVYERKDIFEVLDGI